MAAKLDDWNDDILDDIGAPDYSGLTVYSRDWTVDTILTQLRQGNIDINPKFQRRNAWKDKRRSLLIESLIMGVPVPEIVLAECKEGPKRQFVVLDGKQRLLTLAGFIDHDEFGFWDDPTLSELTTRKSLNGLRFEGLSTDEERALMNADIRCTVIANYKTDDVLYDIFYRLNTGSVPLSTQELRQVLKRGPFADYLVETTNAGHPIQRVLRLNGPDDRLRDVEILLRHLAWEIGRVTYAGNLKKFLDQAMDYPNQHWRAASKLIASCDARLRQCITSAAYLLGQEERIGRKFVKSKWEPQFNKAVFEVEMYYFRRLLDHNKLPKKPTDALIRKFRKQQDKLWQDDEFVRSIEVTTKSLEQYRVRFGLFEAMVNRVFGTKLSHAKQLFPE